MFIRLNDVREESQIARPNTAVLTKFLAEPHSQIMQPRNTRPEHDR
jgi:hypothetical protein